MTHEQKMAIASRLVGAKDDLDKAESTAYRAGDKNLARQIDLHLGRIDDLLNHVLSLPITPTESTLTLLQPNA
jgi:hypothetical protein